MESPLKNKSYTFSLNIIKLYKHLSSQNKEYVLSKQILRSGTAIGALISEAKFGQSRADFISKMNIALKEANETDYWLSLLKDSGYIDEQHYTSLNKDINELISMLAATVKTLKDKQ